MWSSLRQIQPKTAALTSTEVSLPAQSSESLGKATDQLVQQVYAPAAVLVNADGDVLYISGRTGKYLEPAAGKFNMNIHAMAREGLRDALVGVIHMALGQTAPIHLHGVKVCTDGGMQVVHVIVQAMAGPEPLRGKVLLVFKDVALQVKPRRGRGSPTVATHDTVVQELTRTRDLLQSTHEEMQGAAEALKSSNEELQSTNEEFQSTNEELTTSREEMQSMNEELQTVNAELQSKVEDLLETKSDMANLLNSIEIAVIFLDAKMTLRRFTARATRLFKLIPGDVGRPFSDVVTELVYPELIADAKEVLHTLAFRESQIGSRDGRRYRVRIMPYRTIDNLVDGVVMTFTDVTQIHQVQLASDAGGKP